MLIALMLTLRKKGQNPDDGLRLIYGTPRRSVLTCKYFGNFPFELKNTASNVIDASHSISRNIAEGYCRRGLNEYLNHLNTALGSCGEFHSCYESFKQAGQITDEEYDELENLHYKVENELLKLIQSLQKKQKHDKWLATFD